MSKEEVSSNEIKSLPDPNKLANKFLRCTECSSYTEAPLYVCRKGHPICSNCCTTDQDRCSFTTLTTVEICHQGYLKMPMHLHQYIHSNSVFYCPNLLVGCPMEMKGKYIKEHLEDCDFRSPSHCIYTDCQLSSIELATFNLHLSMDHEADTIVDNNAKLHFLFNTKQRVKNPTRSPCVFLCYEAKFAFIIHEYEDRIAMWVALIHGPAFKKYKAMFTIPYNKPLEKAEENAEAEKEKVRSYFHLVHSLNMPADEIVELCECLDMPLHKFESDHLVKEEDNRLVLPIDIQIECFGVAYEPGFSDEPDSDSDEE